MLGKLIKYDLKASAKIFLLLHVIFLLICAAARFLPLCLRGERKTKPAEAGGGSATLGTRQHRSLFCRDAALKY